MYGLGFGLYVNYVTCIMGIAVVYIIYMDEEILHTILFFFWRSRAVPGLAVLVVGLD